jgi:hypothetical protein
MIIRNLKILFSLSAILIFLCSAKAQSKKVLIEEYTGTACGNCPMGVYYIDSMQKKHNGVIAVSIHAFQPYDAMNFSEIDSLFPVYAGGVPCGAIDRILWPGGKSVVARQPDSWDTIIRNRLKAPAELTVTLTGNWNESNRNITADVSVEILSNLSAGDYRLNLYVLEDSITGTGSGYDQLNYYDQTKGNPFYGRGNPIIGYVHRHVARALLPSPWGLSGLIPSAAPSGQIYSHRFNYTLPVKFNEKKVRLIAYVYRISSDHKKDEVLNADEVKLISHTTHFYTERAGMDAFTVYPNPANENIVFSVPAKGNYPACSILVSNALGKVVMAKTGVTIASGLTIGAGNLPEGIYLITVMNGSRLIGNQKVLINR